MDDSVKNTIQKVIEETFEQNAQIVMISLSDETGLPILTYSKDENGKISEVNDYGITNRYAALAGASTTLGERTLSTISQQEKVRLIHVQGKDRDVAISVSPQLICLVVTYPSGSPNLIAERLTSQLKSIL